MCHTVLIDYGYDTAQILDWFAWRGAALAGHRHKHIRIAQVAPNRRAGARTQQAQPCAGMHQAHRQRNFASADAALAGAGGIS